MVVQKPYQEVHSIVFAGEMNPSIFHPAWFGANGLIAAKEQEDATVEIIHSEIAAFQASWLECRVTRKRFQVSTGQEAYFPPLRDLSIGTFRLLEHTPLKLLGINLALHFQCESEKSWHGVGDVLAPKAPWGSLLQKPGLRNLIMEGKRPDERLGYIHVTVEPSPVVKPGLFVSVNDHYQVPAPSDGIWRAKDALDILVEEWAKSVARSRQIAQALIEVGVAE